MTASGVRPGVTGEDPRYRRGVVEKEEITMVSVEE